MEKKEIKITSLKTFRESRKVMSVEDYTKKFGYYDFEDYPEMMAKVKNISSYNGWHINNMVDGSFNVIYDRSEVNGTLEQCERALWDDFGRYELLTGDEREEEAHGRAKEWLDANNYDCSLDEVKDKDLTEEQKIQKDYLLNLFE